MKSVLIVDDEPELRDALCEALMSDFESRAQIAEASNGEEAINWLKKNNCDLMITDLKMPRIDGESLIRMAGVLPPKHRPRHIVILSGFTSNTVAASSKKTNLSYVQKPVDFDEFSKAIGAKLFKDAEADANKEQKPQSSSRLKVDFINPFIAATLDVLQIMAETEAFRDEIFVRSPDQPSGDISAIISMNSEKFYGSMAISFEKECFLDIASRMLDEKYSRIDNKNKDAAAELCNQVFGMTKASLNQEFGIKIGQAIPSVIVGDQHSIKHMIPGKCLAVRFSTHAGFFYVEAVLSPR